LLAAHHFFSFGRSAFDSVGSGISSAFGSFASGVSGAFNGFAGCVGSAFNGFTGRVGSIANHFASGFSVGFGVGGHRVNSFASLFSGFATSGEAQSRGGHDGGQNELTHNKYPSSTSVMAWEIKCLIHAKSDF
ncbi:MAG: hypothetical protein AAFN48_10180, partial [Pseudomonadota bacterium]